MNHNIKHISISEPCTQNWADMDIAGQGKFCQSCQKTVVDFTGLTNEQILKTLSSSGNTCGRFADGQLENINSDLLIQPKATSFSWRKFSIAAALIGFVPFIKAEGQIKLQTPVVSLLNKPDTLSAIQAGIKNEKITDQLKKDSVDVAPINPEVEELLSGVIGGISVVKTEVVPDQSTLEIIRELFNFYFQ